MLASKIDVTANDLMGEESNDYPTEVAWDMLVSLRLLTNK